MIPLDYLVLRLIRRRLFRASFPRVTVEPLAADLEAFRAVRSRIRPEFLTGDDTRDAVTRIFVRAAPD